jgi:hypothetical protein
MPRLKRPDALPGGRDRPAAAWRIADSTNRVSLLVAASQPMIVPAKASLTHATWAKVPVRSLT